MKATVYEIPDNHIPTTLLIQGPHTHRLSTDGLTRSWLIGFGERRASQVPVEEADFVHFPPPWARIDWSPVDGLRVVNDYLGLQHVYFLRTPDGQAFVGNSVFDIAARTSVTLDIDGVFDLFATGNPLSDRTAFREIRCLRPATVMTVAREVTSRHYADIPTGEIPTENPGIVARFSDAITQAAAKAFDPGDAVELTEGRDSMLVVSGLRRAGLGFRTWTFGDPSASDVVGAIQRSRRLHVAHQLVQVSQAIQLSQDEVLRQVTRYLKLSGGMTNVIEYFFLPMILGQVEGNRSVSGCGGEAFRGMYYRWMAYNKLWSVGQALLYRGKVREMMPFRSPILRRELFRESAKRNRDEFTHAFSQSASALDAADRYYLSSRAWKFVGSNFTVSGKVKPVVAPLYDYGLVSLLPEIPIPIRSHSRLVRAAILQMTSDLPAGPVTAPRKSAATQAKRLLNRALVEARGAYLNNPLARHLGRTLLSREALESLLSDGLVTAPLYNMSQLERHVRASGQERGVRVSLGTVLTLELLLRELGSNARVT